MRIKVFFTLLLSLPVFAQAAPLSVKDFGAKGDGQTDDTATFQKALQEASKAGGGTVFAPRGNYFFAGHLEIPDAVTLEGEWKSVPAHNGIRDIGLPKPTDDGTTFLVTESAGAENGPPFLALHNNSTLRGVVIYYPKQNPDEQPQPYPYAIQMRGKNPSVVDVELLNPYNGIDASNNDRHFIRNVQGQPLRRGIYVDNIWDIGRIENVHFNPWWSVKPKVINWQKANGEAFVFARSDWEYVLNTFCFGYKIGYKFVRSSAGVCNGNFLGIGADDCFTSLVVEDCANFGVLISNGEFVSFHGPDPTMVDVQASNTGSIRFSNCAFWGPCFQIAKVAGKGTVGFSDCTFCDWDRDGKGRPAIKAESGKLLVRGCEFQKNAKQIELGEKTRRVVISDNIIAGAVRIENHSKGKALIHDNAGD